MGAALTTMVANLSANKRGWDDRWEEFSDYADRGLEYQSQLLSLVDADTAAFNGLMDAYGMPKGTDVQVKERKNTIEAATKHAIAIPMQVAEIACEAMDVAEAMALVGNPNSITDSGVGAMCLRTAVLGAVLNAKINTEFLTDKNFVNSTIKRCKELVSAAAEKEMKVLTRVDEVLLS
jgi:glutamate formiminotransferase/formiminotetrahydrofolate cyclodeaminase